MPQGTAEAPPTHGVLRTHPKQCALPRPGLTKPEQARGPCGCDHAKPHEGHDGL